MEVKLVDQHEQGVDVEFFKKRGELHLIDVEGVNRHFVTFEFGGKKDSETDINIVIRDFLKCRFRLPVKYLASPQDIMSFQYRAQKRPVIGGNHDDRSQAVIQTEPVNSNMRDYITRIPISQKLPLGTVARIDVSIPYDNKPNGEMEDQKFLSTDSLIFDSKHPHPCMRKTHICAIDIGSELRAKYEVRLYDRDIGRMTIFGFRRPKDNQLTLWMYDVYEVTFKELFQMYLDYLDSYKPPVIKYQDANQTEYTVLDVEKLKGTVKNMMACLK